LIATGLDRERYEPIVVLPDRGPLAADLEAAGVEVIVRPLGVLRRALATPRGGVSVAAAAARDALALGSLIRSRRVVVVHSNTSVVLGGAAAAAAARVPHIWHVREIFAGFERAWPGYRRLLLRAAAVPCVSRATASQFGGSARVSVIPDGLAVDPHRRPRADARAALGLSLGTPVVAVLGRISTWKGQEVLIRALGEVPLRDCRAVALIAGDVWPGADERLEAVRSWSRAIGVGDRVRFLGFRDDTETIYGAADVVVVPSTAPDPLPNAAIEAAAAGCAVVASAHGGLPEILRDGETGRLVAPGDAAGLARSVRALIDDPVERERLGAAAALDVRDRFAPGRLLAATHELYGRFS
jgi:glycosyltransferase involved in cell wall biosynthesis